MTAATWAMVIVGALVLISAGLTRAQRRIERDNTAFAEVTADDWETE